MQFGGLAPRWTKLTARVDSMVKNFPFMGIESTSSRINLSKSF